MIKFLGFEQIFKNALTGLPMGGGKGGSDFDPKGKSDNEVMRFCQSFMTELYRHVGDVHRRARRRHRRGRPRDRLHVRPVQAHHQPASAGVLTGKGLDYGGSLVRTEATGYGAAYFVQEMLKARGEPLRRQDLRRLRLRQRRHLHDREDSQLGRQGRRLLRLDGVVYDETGIDVELVKQLKERERRRIREYLGFRKHARYVDGGNIWEIPCEVAMPSATQNELTGRTRPRS